MRAFYHPDQALHDPKQFMRVGVIADPTDLPERTARSLERGKIAVLFRM